MKLCRGIKTYCLWAHMIRFDPDWEPYIKKIRKAQRLTEYKIITDQMFR